MFRVSTAAASAQQGADVALLLTQVCKAPTLRHKLRCLLTGPGYRPTLHRDVPPPINDSVTRVKYAGGGGLNATLHPVLKHRVVVTVLHQVQVRALKGCQPVRYVQLVTVVSPQLWRSMEAFH